MKATIAAFTLLSLLLAFSVEDGSASIVSAGDDSAQYLSGVDASPRFVEAAGDSFVTPTIDTVWYLYAPSCVRINYSGATAGGLTYNLFIIDSFGNSFQMAFDEPADSSGTIQFDAQAARILPGEVEVLVEFSDSFILNSQTFTLSTAPTGEWSMTSCSYV